MSIDMNQLLEADAIPRLAMRPQTANYPLLGQCILSCMVLVAGLERSTLLGNLSHNLSHGHVTRTLQRR